MTVKRFPPQIWRLTRFPPQIWRMTYAHDKRAHRHRCQACSRIIETGESVYMARVSGRRTHVVHVACSGAVADPHSGITHVELMGVHSAAAFNTWQPYKDQPMGDELLAMSREAIREADHGHHEKCKSADYRP